MAKKKIAVIGMGKIGGRVIRVAESYGREVVVQVNSQHVMTPDGEMIAAVSRKSSPEANAEVIARACLERGVQAVMLALPSSGDGSIEAAIAEMVIANNMVVVTAGKPMIGNQYFRMGHLIGKIGHNATVGGGTDIPWYLKRQLRVSRDHPFTLTAVLNGTLNFAQSRLFEGASADQICDQALDLKFTEPGINSDSVTPLEMYNGELRDVKLKLCILANTLLQPLIGCIVTEADFPTIPLVDHDIARIMGDASNLVYLVRISTMPNAMHIFTEAPLSGGSMVRDINGVMFAAGFIPLQGPLATWVPKNVDNACHISQNGSYNVIRGQGAGPVPTVQAMYADLSELLGD